MKTPARKARMIAAAAVVLIVSLGLVVFAQSGKKNDPDPKRWGLRLVLGDQGLEPAQVTSESLKAALASKKQVDGTDKGYKVRYHDDKDNWEEGQGDISLMDMRPTGSETGSPTPTQLGILTVSGVHGTQQISFSNVTDLKAFTDQLQSPTPAQSPTP